MGKYIGGYVFFSLFFVWLFFVNVISLREKKFFSVDWKDEDFSGNCKNASSKNFLFKFPNMLNRWNGSILNGKYFFNMQNKNESEEKKKKKGKEKEKNFLFIKGCDCKHLEETKRKDSTGNTSGSHSTEIKDICELEKKDKEWILDHEGNKIYTRKEKDAKFSLQNIDEPNKKDFPENKEHPLKKYMDQINEYLDIENYKQTYGNETYNEILQLYVKREIPSNYVEKYFSENIHKSVAFQENEYDDLHFQHVMEKEFKENGINIENIDKKYYDKKNIKRIQKILNYLPLLKLINIPNDLKKLKKEYIPLLIHELKTFIFFIVNLTSGHFSSTLGLAELQVLLLYIFNLPFDNIMYDVGHQVYIHKILTGRKYLFLSLRMKQGLSGFFAASESIYDTFITGHSSNSLSAVQGFYEADRHLHQLHYSKEEEQASSDKKKNEKTASDKSEKFYIAIIGDGGITGGMALEALNYISFLNSKVLIIYNDNGEISLPTNTMSISGNKPIGSIADHTFDINKNKKQVEMKDGESIKMEGNKPLDKNIFQNLNYEYIGPINGNNINELYEVLMKIKKNGIQKPTILHLITNKTNKYIDKRSPISKWHTIGVNEIFPFDITWLDDKNMEEELNLNKQDEEKKKIEKSTSLLDKPHEKKTMTEIYTEEMMKYLEKNKNIIMISPATFAGTGIVPIGNKFPQNTYDVGIAEQHAVTFSTAMAKRKKLKVFLNVYSTFLQRGYDQLIHDLNLQKIPLKIIISRSGLIGGDGATHQGIYDLTVMGALNNASIISPSNQIDLKKSLRYAYNDEDHTLFIRLPKGGIYKDSYLKEYMNIQQRESEETSETEGSDDMEKFFGKARIIQMANDITSNKVDDKNYTTEKKKKVVILNMGYLLYHVIAAVKEMEKEKDISDKFSFSIIDMIFLNPFDKNIIDFIIKENQHKYIISYEDNTIGGFATHLNNYLIQNNYITKYNLYVHNIYLPNEPLEHASISDQCEFARVDKHSIIKRIKKLLSDS